MNLKNGKVFASKFVGTRALVLWKKKLSGRDLTKVEKNWSMWKTARLYSTRRHYGAERVIAVLYKAKGEKLVRVCAKYCR